MKNFLPRLGLALLLSLGLLGAKAQSSFLDLTIVETSNYNKSVGNFAFSNFENMFKITSAKPPISEANINRALTIFLNILEPQRSYIIQHEPTYYFVFQYNEKDNNYLVMNNSIGEKNEAMFCNTFGEAKKQMFVLLQTFYHNIPMVSIKEYK